jgi:hypothetical protein
VFFSEKKMRQKCMRLILFFVFFYYCFFKTFNPILNALNFANGFSTNRTVMTYFHETFWLAMSDGMMNYYNAHVWADANPHVIRQDRFESGFSIHL